MVKVPREDRMDDETFRKHMELRHSSKEELAGLKAFHPETFGQIRGLIGFYHARLHRDGRYDHEHDR